MCFLISDVAASTWFLTHFQRTEQFAVMVHHRITSPLSVLVASLASVFPARYRHVHIQHGI